MNRKNNTSIQMIADYDGDISKLFEIDAPKIVPVLTTRNVVLFPGVVIPIVIGRDQSIKLIEHLTQNPDNIFAVFCQKSSDIENPKKKDLSSFGVYAKLVRIIDIPTPAGNTTAIVQAFGKCELNDIVQETPFIKATISRVEEEFTIDHDKEYNSAVADTRSLTSEFIRLSDEIPDESVFAFNNIHNDILAVNFACTNLPFEVKDKLKMLKTNSAKERIYLALKALNKGIQLLNIKQNIRNKTRVELDEQQREYFLQQQIKNIREELGKGEGTPERKDLETKAKANKWSKEIKAVFDKELDKLDMLNTQSPEYSMQVGYLQTFVSLPWGKFTKDNINISRAKKVLDSDHYGMEKVKERILEHLAVLQLSGDLKSPIICLYGPPGVGKTSLGKSIATAMKRKYVRISLGGLHDEAEIRGHRRTYIGAMPGRIIKGLQKAGSSNPVFILDEIDKVSQNNFHGDPSSALLEVLDPEQNSTFHDNYLDVDYDLSNILFVATANELNSIPLPLLDRMELIDVSGYITEEKIEIARRHLIPRALEATGFAKENTKPTFTKEALENIIEKYTRESGVRQLEKQIDKALRKLAYLKTLEEQLPFEKITNKELITLLGKPPYYRDIYQGNDYAGVVTGLAWTSVGGEILYIETSLSKSQSGKLTLTGNLGNVMKESATIALEYVKAHASLLNIDYRIFEKWNIHIHVPEGATPKDGPSAGITIATSIASALTQRKIKKNIAMTGEITLRGKVLPVGGIKEKILAAKRAGITDIVLCGTNKKDIDDIPEQYLTGLTFHYVEDVTDVWDIALTDEIVDNPVVFDIEDKKVDIA